MKLASETALGLDVGPLRGGSLTVGGVSEIFGALAETLKGLVGALVGSVGAAISEASGSAVASPSIA